MEILKTFYVIWHGPIEPSSLTHSDLRPTPIPWSIAPRLFLALWTRERRSFREDARRAVGKLKPPLKISGSPVVDRRCLLTVNHYSRRGFQAWWIALAVSSATPRDIHWVITAAWRYPDQLRSWLITPTSRWVLQRIARIYNFTIMPQCRLNPMRL